MWAMFADTARRSAHAVALRDLSRSYTYGQVYAGCMSAAGALAADGVRPGDAVLVCADQTADGVLAILAVCAAAATPVPVEPDGPQARFARIVAASGARIAVADEAGRAAVSAAGIPALDISGSMSSGLAGPQAASAAPAGPQAAPAPPAGSQAAPAALAGSQAPAAPAGPGRSDLAYILFTSGSTGAPKGVEVTQANMASLLGGAARWEGSTAADVWGCYHAFTFDISMWEIWRPLTLGAQVFVFPRVAQVDGDLAYELAGRQGITVLCQTPTAVRLLANRVSRSGMPTGLRRLMLAGERLDFAALRPLAGAVSAGQLEIWNLYGPTEATIYSTGYRITVADIQRERRSLIGRALPGVETAVHEPDADGIGELWIGGGQVAAGYRGDPELTRDRFITDAAGQRAYRTCDLVRDRGDGVLEFIGRAGGFIKVRGYRVEPGEIVSALCAHPAVEEAAAFVTEVLPWGATIVGAVVPKQGEAVAEIALRRHATVTLPHYMRPGRIVMLNSLPRLRSGKLDELTLRSAIEQRLVAEQPAGARQAQA